ncbi:MAG: hypothetical protein MR998_01545 [Lachnospiraceae bacterium]|nr:hypothetical protein [Lachnospiraceae bacterium]
MKNLHSSAKSHHQNHATLSVVLYVIAAFIAVFAVYTTFAAGSNLIAYASIQEQDISFLTDIIPAVFQQSFPMYAYALIFLTFGKTYDKVFAVYNKTFHLESSVAKEAVKPEDSEPKEAKAETQEEIVPEEEIVQDFVERCAEEESGEAVEEEISDEESETTKDEASTEESEENEESKEEAHSEYSEEESEE